MARPSGANTSWAKINPLSLPFFRFVGASVGASNLTAKITSLYQRAKACTADQDVDARDIRAKTHRACHRGALRADPLALSRE
jgi:hypothetical protein